MGRDLHMFVEEECGPKRSRWWRCVAEFFDISWRNPCFFDALLKDSLGAHRGIPNPSTRVERLTRDHKKDHLDGRFGHSWLTYEEFRALIESLPLDQRPADAELVAATMGFINGSGRKSRVVYWFDS